MASLQITSPAAEIVADKVCETPLKEAFIFVVELILRMNDFVVPAETV